MPDVAVRKQLETLIRQTGEGYAEVSRLIGRNAAYVQQYIKRGVPRRLGEVERRLLAAHFGVPESLLGGPPDSTLKPDSSLQRPSQIPYLQEPGGTSRTLTVDPAFFGRASPVASRTLAALVVHGDAMSPTLLAGDHVLIDRDDKTPPFDGLYVLECESGPVVKRLSVNPVTRRIAILSDNAAYPSFPNCNPADLTILGRVVWLGRAVD